MLKLDMINRSCIRSVFQAFCVIMNAIVAWIRPVICVCILRSRQLQYYMDFYYYYTNHNYTHNRPHMGSEIIGVCVVVSNTSSALPTQRTLMCVPNTACTTMHLNIPMLGACFPPRNVYFEYEQNTHIWKCILVFVLYCLIIVMTEWMGKRRTVFFVLG